jgi:hypothetical protein
MSDAQKEQYYQDEANNAISTKKTGNLLTNLTAFIVA